MNATFNTRRLAALSVSALAFASCARAQNVPALPEPGAKVDETAIQTTLHVDQAHAAASDTAGAGRGEVAKPFKSIGAAGAVVREMLARGTGVRVVVHPGLYRENLGGLVQGEGQSAAFKDAPFVVESSGPGVVISGAIERNETHDFRPATWKAVAGHPGVYEHGWSFNWGPWIGPWANDFGATLSSTPQRREMLIVDGRVLKQSIVEQYKWQDTERPNRGGTCCRTGATSGPVDVLHWLHVTGPPA